MLCEWIVDKDKEGEMIRMKYKCSFLNRVEVDLVG
jgi:hypothetical protein